jgi:hypothetical protein
MEIYNGDTITWSTLPNGQGVIKSGVVTQVHGRWLHVVCTDAPEAYQDEIGQTDIVLAEFIFDAQTAQTDEPVHFYL